MNREAQKFAANFDISGYAGDIFKNNNE